MATTTICVLGASGPTGSAVCKYLSTHARATKIVGAMRDPTSEKARELGSTLGPNVSFVRADLAIPDTVAAAVTGADIVFVNVPATQNRAELAIRGVEAARLAHAKHIVVLSVLTADLPQTIFGAQFQQIESAVKQSGIPFTILRFPLFMDNNWGNQQSIKGENKFFGAQNPDAKYTPVAVADVGEAIGAVLVNPTAHMNKIYSVSSSSTSQNEIAVAFTKATGKPVEYVQIPYDKAKTSFMSAGYPEWQVDGILELQRLIDQGSPITNNQSQDFKLITGHDPLTFEQWVTPLGPAFK